jgi:hypothetical protein
MKTNKNVQQTIQNIIWLSIFQGVLFLFLAFGVVFYPKLLNQIFAVVFVIAGVGFIGLGLKLWKFYNQTKSWWKKMLG